VPDVVRVVVPVTDAKLTAPTANTPVVVDAFVEQVLVSAAVVTQLGVPE
jgi:hypothetical protein